jgi:predicted choloylglycine hydrolase
MSITEHPEISVVAGGSDGDAVTVRYLRLAGTDREIGRDLALAARAVHGAPAGPTPAPDRTVQRVRRRWFDQHHPVLAERMLGVADAFGVDADDDRFDLAWLATYAGPAGCSTVVYPGSGTKDGHTLLARNFDFPTATIDELMGLPARPGTRRLAADPWIVELHPEGGLASVVIGIMDVLGGMDGVNEAGLAVSLLADNESPTPEPVGQRVQVGLSEQQVVRYLLDTCTTAAEAQEALLLAKHYYAFVPCHFVVADRTGASFVWEHSPGHNHEHVVVADPATAGRLVCTNHLLHRWPDGADLPEEDGTLGTAALTYTRWRSLDTATGDGAVVDRDDIREHFRAVRFEAPLEGGRTYWHAIYDLEDAAVDVELYVRDDDGRSRYTPPLHIAL